MISAVLRGIVGAPPAGLEALEYVFAAGIGLVMVRFILGIFGWVEKMLPRR